MNIYQLIGTFELLYENRIIHNSIYVEKIGRYRQYLFKLPSRNLSDEQKKKLKERYEHEIKAAKFWAVYPADVSKLSSGEKYKLLTKLRNLDD